MGLLKIKKHVEEIKSIICCVNSWYYKIMLKKFKNSKTSIFFPFLDNQEIK
jgi:hypothetical protein